MVDNHGDQIVQRWVWIRKDEEAMIGAHDGELHGRLA
jgi:hypothetical protein